MPRIMFSVKLSKDERVILDEVAREMDLSCSEVARRALRHFKSELDAGVPDDHNTHPTTVMAAMAILRGS